jgi:Icc-related predicted phosphoesterase
MGILKKNIWLISDTHRKHQELIVPSSIDIVIFAGDCSNARSPYINQIQVDEFMEWYSGLYIPHKVFVPGNHDTSIHMGLINIPSNITLLIDELVIIDGIKIYGSPYTPKYGEWAYMYERGGDRLSSTWEMIPDKLNILVTHGPSKGILDDIGHKNVGCELLATRLQNIELDVHVFGHIHECSGRIHVESYNRHMPINASVVDVRHDLANNGTVIEYEYSALVDL